MWMTMIEDVSPYSPATWMEEAMVNRIRLWKGVAHQGLDVEQAVSWAVLGYRGLGFDMAPQADMPLCPTGCGVWDPNDHFTIIWGGNAF